MIAPAPAQSDGAVGHLSSLSGVEDPAILVRSQVALRDFGRQVDAYLRRHPPRAGVSVQQARGQLAAVLAQAAALASDPASRPAAGWDALVADGLEHAMFDGPVGYLGSLPGVDDAASLVPGQEVPVTATQLIQVSPEAVPAGDVLFVVARPEAHDIGELAGDRSGRIMLAQGRSLRVVRVSVAAGGRRVVYLARPDGALFPPVGEVPEAGDGGADGLPRGWEWLNQGRGLAIPIDPELTGVPATTREEWVEARPGTGRGYVVHLPTGMIAMPGRARRSSRAHSARGVLRLGSARD